MPRKRKINWTLDYLASLSIRDIKKLTPVEIKRAVNKFYTPLNRRIAGLEELANQGYYVPAIENIKLFSSGSDLSSKNKILNELLRMRQFIGLETSSKEGVKKQSIKNRNRLSKLLERAGYKTDILKRMGTKDLSNIWKIYRLTEESNPNWYNEHRIGQITMAYKIGLFKDVDFNNNDEVFSVINKLYGKDLNYEMKLREIMDRYNFGEDYTLKNARSDWSDFIEKL